MNKKLLDGEHVFVIDGFLSAEECERLIARSEAIGYEAASVGDVLIPQIRNNARVDFRRSRPRRYTLVRGEALRAPAD